MQADQFGTPTEQQRHREGWLAPAVRRANGFVANADARCCRFCRHAARIVGYRCQKHRFTTQAMAVCGSFSRSPAA